MSQAASLSDFFEAVARKTKLDIPARYGYKADLPLGVGFLVEERTTVKVLEKAIAIPSGQSNSQGYMILYAYCQKAGVESILQGQLPPMMPATKKEPAEFADLAAIADNFVETVQNVHSIRLETVPYLKP